MPLAIEIGAPLLALLVLTAALLVALFGRDGGDDIDPVGVALVVVSSTAWMGWLGDLILGHDADLTGLRRAFVPLVIGPYALLVVAGWIWEVDLGSNLAWQLMSLPLVLLVIIVVVVCPPRMAVPIVAAVYAVSAAGLLLGFTRNSEIDWTGSVMWTLSLGIAAGSGWAVRQGALAMLRARRAREALAWQSAANERRRIARDVHDVVAHTLSVSMLHMSAARMAVQRAAPGDAIEALEEAERNGRASLADIRRIVHLLRSEDESALDAVQPDVTDVSGLVECYRSAGVPVKLKLTGSAEGVSATTGLALYRVTQEALTNATRHGAGPPTVDLRIMDAEITLRVRNATDARAVRDSDGSGLLGMQERISAAGGTLRVGPKNGEWVVEARVPTNGDDAEQTPIMGADPQHQGGREDRRSIR